MLGEYNEPKYPQFSVCIAHSTGRWPHVEMNHFSGAVFRGLAALDPSHPAFSLITNARLRPPTLDSVYWACLWPTRR